MRKKWFEVAVTSVKVYAVEVCGDETAEQAVAYALNDFRGTVTASTATPVGYSPSQINSLKRRADEVLTDRSHAADDDA